MLDETYLVYDISFDAHALDPDCPAAPNTAPVITGGATAAVNAAENQTAVTDLATSDDVDSEGSGLTYSITGGVDSASFSIVSGTGVLTFNSAPDFENPTDVGANNIYDVQITVTDSAALTDVQSISITVTDIFEDITAPTLTITGAPEEITDNSPFSITYTFDENVTGFDLNDINAGLINATASNFIAHSPSIYSADIIPNDNGNIEISVNENAA